MAFANPPTQYVTYGNGTSTGYYAVSAWTASHSYAAGAMVRQLAAPTIGNERVFVCVVAGTSGSSEPAWTVTKGGKTTDSGATWQECTGIAGVNGDISSGANPSWVASSSTTLGQVLYDAASSSLQINSTAGITKSGTQPTFSATAGATTTDNTATWTSLGAASGFSAWAAPHARLANASASGWTFAGQNVYVGSNHAETQATAITMSFAGTVSAPTSLICTPTTSAPPTTSATGASVTVSANAQLTINDGGSQVLQLSGIAFSSAGSMTIMDDSGTWLLVCAACSFSLTGVSGGIGIGYTNGQGIIQLRDGCSISLASTVQDVNLAGCQFIWKGGTCVMGGSLSATASIFNTNGGVTAFIEGVDFTSVEAHSIATYSSTAYFCIKDCSLRSGLLLATNPANGSGVIDGMRNDSAGTNYQIEHHTGTGDCVTNTSIVRTGGASDGATPVSHFATTIATLNIVPFDSIPLNIWNTVLSTNRNVTLYGLANTPAMPTNAQFWFDVAYQGSASAALATVATGNPNGLGTTPSALTADTSAWDSEATSWAASTVYAVGQAVKVSSNSGRIFFVSAISSSGTSSSSLPGGFATAVDGGSVTDNLVTWRAGWRFKMTVTLSSPQPAQVGYFTAYPRYSVPSQSYYIDPLVVLS